MRVSFLIGLRALGASPLRTALSTLGVVVGVGALVSVLAMGDGVERTARTQIERTTSLQSVVVRPRTTARLDGLTVPIHERARLTEADRTAARRIPGVAAATLVRTGAVATVVAAGEPPRGVTVIAYASDGSGVGGLELTAGSWPASRGSASGRPAAALSVALAEAGGVTVGDSVRLHETWWTVTGIAAAPGATALQAVIPIGDAALVWPDTTGFPVEQLFLDVESVEAVPAVVDSAKTWVAGRFPNGADRVDVLTNQMRVQQVRQAMLIFKLLMGAIAGISLIVGGIGIMNVLLASVTERTREIGVRKAAGARQRDILLQFLTEAVVVTGGGSAVGLLLGIGTAQTVAVFMRRQTEAEIFPVLTAPTVLVAVTAAVAVGLVFGLYPALRAARLSPVEAIRHE